MGENSKISWCDHTWNVWIGCTQVSPACDHCYAMEQNKYRKWVPEWNTNERYRTRTNFLAKWDAAGTSHFAKHGRFPRVFVNSLSDFFDNKAHWRWRDDAWKMMRQCPHLIFMLLTKRPQNIEDMLPEFWDEIAHRVWLGTTAENAEEEARRRPHLLKHRQTAGVLYYSCEPLLGFVDIPEELDLVIGGGESGTRARPWHPAWRAHLREQCEAAGIAFFWKQNGVWRPYEKGDDEARLVSKWIMDDGEIRPPGEMVNFEKDWRRMVRHQGPASDADYYGDIIQEMPEQALIDLAA